MNLFFDVLCFWCFLFSFQVDSNGFTFSFVVALVTHAIAITNRKRLAITISKSQAFPAEIAVNCNVAITKIALGQKNRCDSESHPCSRNVFWGGFQTHVALPKHYKNHTKLAVPESKELASKGVFGGGSLQALTIVSRLFVPGHPCLLCPRVLFLPAFLESVAMCSLPGPRRGWDTLLEFAFARCLLRKRLSTCPQSSLSLSFLGFQHSSWRLLRGVLVFGDIALDNRHPQETPIPCMVFAWGIFSFKARRCFNKMLTYMAQISKRKVSISLLRGTGREKNDPPLALPSSPVHPFYFSLPGCMAQMQPWRALPGTPVGGLFSGNRHGLPPAIRHPSWGGNC